MCNVCGTPQEINRGKAIPDQQDIMYIYIFELHTDCILRDPPYNVDTSIHVP